MERKRKSGEDDLVVNVLPVAKKGHPLLDGEALDSHIKVYIRSHRVEVGPLMSLIIIAVGRAIL